MLVLLPPSEGKTPPADGAPVDLAELSAAALTRQRAKVLGALIRTSRRRDAADVLGTGPTLAHELERNTRLRTEPAAPAHDVYTGVLYAAAGLDTLPDDAARDRADSWVRTVSALWGVVAPSDRIPAYRLAMGTTLPAVGPLAAFWRPALRTALDPEAADRLVVDCRSAPYAAAWTPPTAGPGHVQVTAVREVEGRRTVVSHWAKHTRGVLVRHLVTRDGPAPASPQDLLAAARELVGSAVLDAELTGPTRGRYTLALLVP